MQTTSITYLGYSIHFGRVGRHLHLDPLAEAFQLFSNVAGAIKTAHLDVVFIAPLSVRKRETSHKLITWTVSTLVFLCVCLGYVKKERPAIHTDVKSIVNKPRQRKRN